MGDEMTKQEKETLLHTARLAALTTDLLTRQHEALCMVIDNLQRAGLAGFGQIYQNHCANTLQLLRAVREETRSTLEATNAIQAPTKKERPN